MASALTILDDIDDKFCQCCLCFEQYKDPRQLPCFHRYCSGCLDEEINRNNGKLNCPLCQQEVDVPKEGAQGLVKDFFMNEIIEFLEIKKTFQDEEHECGDCSANVKATSYCFRCSVYLCAKCNEYHLSLNSLKEHRPYLLTLKDIESQNITLKKLSSLKQAPMCQTHPDDISRLCCKTCGNIPICLACTYGDHKTHELEDVISFARVQKERLKHHLTSLNDSKAKAEEMAGKAAKLEEDVATIADQKIAEISARSDEELMEIVRAISSIELESYAAIEHISVKELADSSSRRQQLEEKITQLKKEYDIQEANCIKEIESRISRTNEMYRKKETKLGRKREIIQREVRNGNALIEKEKAEKLTQTAELVESLENTVQRLQNLAETGSNILVSENNWTAIQNVDRICLASVPLLQEVARELPYLDMLEYPQVRLEKVERIRISEKPEIVVDLGDIKSKGWFINGVAATEGGNIVITGGTTEKQAHISVIDSDLNILKQKLIESNAPRPFCVCAYFKDDQIVVATRCNAHIGLYCVHDNSYCKVNLSEVIGREVEIRGIAADEETNLIIVGCQNGHVLYVLNDKLKLVRTMDLPENIRSLTDIGLNDGKLFVCDGNRGTACAVSLDGTLLYEFSKPEILKCRMPFSMCSDEKGLVHMLWTEKDSALSEQNCVLVQYNPDDGHTLTTVAMQAVQGWITTAEIDGEEKLLLPSQHSGKLRVFGLYEE